MVSPAKMDPSYKPTPIPSNAGYDLRSGWASSPSKPAVSLKRQKSAHLVESQKGENANGSISTIVEGPAVGMFPTKLLDSKLHMTQLYPIPLSFSGPVGLGIDTSARSADSSSTDMTKRVENSSVRTDIPASLPVAVPKTTRRMTRSSTLMLSEPLPSPQAPVELGWTPEQQLKSLIDTQDSPGERVLTSRISSQHLSPEQTIEKSKVIQRRKQTLAARRKERKNTESRAAAGPYQLARNATEPSALTPSAPVQPSHPQYLERITVGSLVAADYGPKHLERTVVSQQITISQAPKHLERIAENPVVVIDKSREIGPRNLYVDAGSQVGIPWSEGVVERGLVPNNPKIATEKSSITADHVPKYFGQVMAKPPVAVDHVSSAREDTKSISWVTPTSSPISVTPSPKDPKNPSVGTTRPGAEILDDYDGLGPGWIFMQSRNGPGPARPVVAPGSTPELVTPSISSTGGDIFMEDERIGGRRVSGSTATSYSQRAGSPTSLISMYKVHGNVRFGKRKGISLLHTKRPYDGERELLDLDMPKSGDSVLMDMEEMEGLMDEMMNGEPTTEVRLASVDRDWESRGECSTDLDPMEWEMEL